MVKRFVLGFLLGVGVMYWYIHHSEAFLEGASQWMENSASEYRGDREHRAVLEETGQRRRP
jgi:hypothetical protein